MNRILTRSEIDIMFVNLEEIVPVNMMFSNSMIMRSAEAKQNNDFPRFGDLFLEYVNEQFNTFRKIFSIIINFLSSKHFY